MSQAPAVVPGAEPFSFEGGPGGVLLLHGFTGNPASLRQIGKWLAARGHAVECPRYPGHGTTHQDLGRSSWRDWVAEATAGLDRLVARAETVVVLGLSMGGAMALHLAVARPDDVRAVAVVNAYLRDRRIVMAPYFWWAIPAQKGIGNDIAKEGADELPYDRVPVRAVAQLARFLKTVVAELPQVRQPLLVMNSVEDHVVPKGTAEWLMERAGSERKELVELPRSYHVATMDHDAEVIFDRTHELLEAALAERRAERSTG